MKFSEFLNEDNRDKLVCSCNRVTVGDLLDKRKFNQGASEEDILGSLKVGKSCGGCLKKTCETKTGVGRCEIYYKKVLR